MVKTLPAQGLWSFYLLAIDLNFLDLLKVFLLQGVEDFFGMAGRDSRELMVISIAGRSRTEWIDLSIKYNNIHIYLQMADLGNH